MAITERRTIEIEAAADEIMAVLTDLERLPEWSPMHRSVEVLTRDDQGRPASARLQIKIVGITAEQELAYEFYDDGVGWTLIRGTNEKSERARYTLTELEPQRTLVQLDLEVELSVPAPGFVVRRGAKGVLKTATEGLRDRVLAVRAGD